MWRFTTEFPNSYRKYLRKYASNCNTEIIKLCTKVSFDKQKLNCKKTKNIFMLIYTFVNQLSGRLRDADYMTFSKLHAKFYLFR